MTNLPIGVFDSGVGGLTVLKKLEQALPQENYIYFGDTARMPYGEKSPEQLLVFVREIIEWFNSKNVKAVVMACNTSSAVVYNTIKDDCRFPVFSLIEPASRYAAYLNASKIGVMATSATVNSRAYTKAIKSLSPSTEVIETACPGLVEIVESNKTDTQEARKLLIRYVVPLLEKGVEKIILGCTHYPFLSGVIGEIAGGEDILIDPARYLADDIAGKLMETDVLNNNSECYKQFYASSNTEMFMEAGKRIYPGLSEIQELDLSKIAMDNM